MHAEQDERALEDLIVEFCDEDLQTWTRAAQVIGRRAVTDGASLEFLRRRLAEAPTATAQQGDAAGYQDTNLRADAGGVPRANVHRFRHACCAMGSYLSQPHPDESLLGDAIDEHIRYPLAMLCFDLLKSEGGTVADLKQIPGMAQQFEKWRRRQIASKQRNVERFRRDGSARALEANERQLQVLQKLGDHSQIPAEFRPATRKAAQRSDWALACYFAGVQTPKALLGFPLPLLVKSLLAVATRAHSAGLPMVLNLPQLLAAIEKVMDPGQWRQAVQLLFDNVSPGWIEARDQYNQYIVGVSSLPGAPPFRKLWEQGIDMPDWLRSELANLEGLVSDPSQTQRADRLSGRIMRGISQRYFGDDWRWKEWPEGEQFSLNVYALLMIHGPAALIPGPGPHDPASPQQSQVDLQHRIALLLDALEGSSRARSTILPPLVRCLKVLLQREMAEFLERTAPRAGAPKRLESLEQLMALCRRQLLMVKPLLTDWLLPSTLRKDLATIVCRILHTAYRQQQQDRTALKAHTARHQEYAVELVYIMLFAFPDNLLLREMIEYSTDDDICRLLDCIRQLIEEFEHYDEAYGQTAATSEGLTRFETAAQSWKRRYKDFTELLSRISLQDCTESRQDRWIDALYSMVEHLTRTRGTLETRGPRSDPERPLQPILQYGQASRQHWRALLDESRGESMDRIGAREERNERESRERLAARAIAGRFEGLLDDVGILESDCLPEFGRPSMKDELVHSWRRLISRLGELSQLCSEELPGLERELCARLINRRTNHELTPRLERIVEILDQEKEGDAKTILTEQAAAPDQGDRDAGLIQDWMLRRYMIRELADSYHLRVLAWLTNWRFILCWILFPFVACAVLNLLGASAWGAVPFAVTCIANFALLLAFALETGRRLPDLGRGKISAWRLLLPQTTAAVFIAVFSTIPSDERWSLTIKANLPIQALTWIIFLVVGFIFTREIMLGGQFRGQKHGTTKSRRAGQLMALSLWQSFTLVTFFGMAVGRIMAASDRGNINPAEFGGLGKLVANLIPVEVYLGEGFLHPAGSREAASFWVYPRALMSWTVQMFFFGAIFERIMRRSGD